MQATARLSNQTQEPVATLLCSVVGPVQSGIAALFSRIAEHTHSRVLMPVRVSPGQFEFKMRFCSAWLERLPLFAIDRHAADVPFL
jgi:hypothetical protein